MIFLLLHGETEWNRRHRFQGRLDSPLTPHGMQQAHQAGKTLSLLIEDLSKCRIVSSPLGRARQTAEIVCTALSVSLDHLTLDPRLMEIDLGSWAGLTRDEVEAKWPRPLDGATRYDWYFRSPDGEALDTAAARLGEWLADIERASETTITISHGVASRILRGLYTNLPIQQALSLQISRDVIFKLADGCTERIPCRPTKLHP